MTYDEIKQKIDNNDIKQYKHATVRDSGTKRQLQENVKTVREFLIREGYKVSDFKRIIVNGWHTYVAYGYREENPCKQS